MADISSGIPFRVLSADQASYGITNEFLGYDFAQRLLLPADLAGNPSSLLFTHAAILPETDGVEIFLANPSSAT